jgi:hypothetical protein
MTEFHARVNEDSSFSIMGRVYVAGELWTQSDVATISFKIWNSSNVEVSSGDLVVSSVVFDTLQTDGRWKNDSIGYNFRHDNDHTVLTEADTYRIEYRVVMATANNFILGPGTIEVPEMLTS